MKVEVMIGHWIQQVLMVLQFL